MARRKLYPMPVEGLIDNPDLLAMPAAGAGIVLRLALHFWATDCRPLPTADHELRNIARAHAPTWRHWKPHVLKVLAAIEPELVAYWRLRETKGSTIRFAQRKGADKLAAMKAANALAEASAATPVTAAGSIPVTAAETAPRPKARPKAEGQPRMLDKAA